MRLCRRFVATLGLSLFVLSAPAPAQTYPKGVVSVVLGAPPGGPTDFAARIVAEQLQAAWNQPVVVVNKPGASGVIAVNMVAKSPPDGQMILLDTTSHVINPALRAATIPYKTPDEFDYVTQLTSLQIVLVANPAAPFNTVSELIAYAKAHPGKISYASPGIGLASHLAAELLKIEAGIDMVHVPYNGSGPAQLDLISGRVDIMFDVYHSAKQFAEQGKIKILALASASQPDNIKAYPLISETIPGFSVTSFFGLIVPRGTPKPIIDKINRDIVTAFNKPDVKARLEKVGMKVVGSKPEEFAEFVSAESAKWAKVIKIGNLKAE